MSSNSKVMTRIAVSRAAFNSLFKVRNTIQVRVYKDDFHWDIRICRLIFFYWQIKYGPGNFGAEEVTNE